jgi:hypothetical protein
MNAIVVGNASSMLEHKNGKIIDNFDKVIRLNKFVIKGFEDYVGTKTDIYCSKWLNMSYNLDIVKLIENIWLPYPKPPRWWTTNGNFKEVAQEQHDRYIEKFNIKNITYLNEDHTKEMEDVFKNVCQPSTGLISLMIGIQELKEYNIYYTGFDNFSTGWYWNPNHNCIKNMQNSILFEKIFLNYVKTKYGIKEL